MELLVCEELIALVTRHLWRERGDLTFTRDAEPGEFANDPDGQYNAAQNEKKYVQLFGEALATAGMPNHAIVDTGKFSSSHRIILVVCAIAAQFLSSLSLTFPRT